MNIEPHAYDPLNPLDAASGSAADTPQHLRISEVPSDTDTPWPIRVGGIYCRKSSPNCFYRVTATAGNIIHHVHQITRSDGDIREFPVRSYSAAVFRILTHPEDASPLSRLYELLTLCLDGDFLPDELQREIAAALAAREVGTHAR